MAALKSTRSAQRVMASEFIFDISAADTLPLVQGNTISGAGPNAYSQAVSPNQALSAIYGGVAQVYDFVNLPQNAEIVGGDIYVQTALVGPTAATLSLGDAGDSVNGASATRYANAVSLLATGRTALTLPGIVHLNGQNLRGTLTLTVAPATAGRVIVRVLYVIQGKNDDVIPV